MLEISVVTASSRRRDLLLAKLASLEAQTLEPERFEWVVCLNGPDDGSAAALQAATPRFAMTVLYHQEFLSPAAARNLAAAQATAPFVLLSDDDCLLEPGCLAAHLHFQKTVPDAVGVGLLRLPEELRDAARREPFEQVASVSGRVLWTAATGANTSVPSAALQRVGGYDESFETYGGEDPDLGFRLRRGGLAFRRVPGAAAFHHGNQLGAEGNDKAFQAGQAHWRVYRKHASAEVGLLLGVHPAVLALKALVVNSLTGRLVRHPRFAYELAYARGARDARRRGLDYDAAPMKVLRGDHD